MNPSSHRKQLFIERKFQARSMLTVIAIIAASGLLSGTLLYFLLANELSNELRTAHLQIQNTWESLAPAIIVGNIITILVTSLVAAIAVLYQSHKIAGPAYRIQKVCEEIGKGNFNPITTLRKSDQLTALAGSVEHMAHSLREKRTQQEAQLTALLGLLNQLRDKEKIDNQENLEQIHDGLKNFTL